VPEEDYYAPHVYYDGPKLVKYLERHHAASMKQLGRDRKRRILGWRSGETANEYTVDTLLTELGTHLDLLPKDLVKGNKLTRQQSDPKMRKEVVERMRAGEETGALAEEVGRTVSCLLKWNQNAPGYTPKKRKAAKYVMRNCLYCEDEFKVYVRNLHTDRHTGQYCSRQCAGKRPQGGGFGRAHYGNRSK